MGTNSSCSEPSRGDPLSLALTLRLLGRRFDLAPLRICVTIWRTIRGQNVLSWLRNSAFDPRIGRAVPVDVTGGVLYRERECPLASAFGLEGADVLVMKTSVGSLKRALSFLTCSKVRLRRPAMNIETALSELN